MDQPSQTLRWQRWQIVMIASIIFGLGTVLAFSTLAVKKNISPAEMPAAFAKQVILYDWENDIPWSVLNAFTQEFGIEVIYKTFDSLTEAVESVKSGNVYDLMVIDNERVPELIEQNLLTPIDYSNVANMRNISANFRDLAYDPHNKHSVPFNWGTTGLLVRTDLIEKPITSWSDLWRDDLKGKIGIRNDERELLAVTLKSLGFSINTEDPKELELAEQRLFELRDCVVLMDSYAEGAMPLLLGGSIAVMIGYAEDFLLAEDAEEPIEYVFPQEGSLLWGDNFVIPASSLNKTTAELFLNYLLRPQVAAQIVNENHYANANEAASSFIAPEIIDNTVIFPVVKDLINAEVFLPLSEQGRALYSTIWTKFLGEALVLAP